MLEKYRKPLATMQVNIRLADFDPQRNRLVQEHPIHAHFLMLCSTVETEALGRISVFETPSNKEPIGQAQFSATLSSSCTSSSIHMSLHHIPDLIKDRKVSLTFDVAILPPRNFLGPMFLFLHTVSHSPASRFYHGYISYFRQNSQDSI